MRKIKVFSIDDSSLIRELLTKIVNLDDELEMVGTAPHPLIAEKKIEDIKPDVITLDIEMPEMDGITFLKRIMLKYPTPVIMFSSLLEKHRELVLDALTLGAFDYLVKPAQTSKEGLEKIGNELRKKIKVANYNRHKITKVKTNTDEKMLSEDKQYLVKMDCFKTTEKISPDSILPYIKTSVTPKEKIIVIGSSTGGTEALVSCLKNATEKCPPIVIVQHMPELFTTSFAKRLNSLLKIEVREAENGMEVGTGQAIVARGNKHIVLKYKNGRYYVDLVDGPLITRHRPSVDVLFRSAAMTAKDKAIGIILTGMGDDGAKCMKEMHDAGAYCIAQDKETSVVFGMPREAIKIGAVDEVLPVDKILAAALK